LLDQAIKNKRNIFSVYNKSGGNISAEVQSPINETKNVEESDFEMSESLVKSKNGRAPSTTSLEDLEKGLHYLNELNQHYEMLALGLKKPVT
jgi:hypothetical protein